jgi:CRP-like cAMP-binding protein
MERLEYFRLFHNIGAADYTLLCESLHTKTFKKGELIIAPGQIQRELYFVKSGVQMSYFDAEDKIHVIAFTYPHNLCAIPESLSFKTPSKYSLVCLSDSEMDYISYEELQKLFDKSQQVERLFRRITLAILSGTIDRHVELHSMTIEERYKAFCRRSPHLLQLVPHKYIASYLGIDATNFSKLFNTVKF